MKAKEEKSKIYESLIQFLKPTKWKLILTISLFILARISSYAFNKCYESSGDVSINICGSGGVLVSILLLFYIIPLGILDETFSGIYLFDYLTTITNFVFIDILIISFYYFLISAIFYIIYLTKKKMS